MTNIRILGTKFLYNISAKKEDDQLIVILHGNECIRGSHYDEETFRHVSRH